jgi:hypothetical protein
MYTTNFFNVLKFGNTPYIVANLYICNPSNYEFKESIETATPAAMVKTLIGSATARDSGGCGGDDIAADPWETDGTGAEIRKINIF